jgi:hypothetical protein
MIMRFNKIHKFESALKWGLHLTENYNEILPATSNVDSKI